MPVLLARYISPSLPPAVAATASLSWLFIIASNRFINRSFCDTDVFICCSINKIVWRNCMYCSTTTIDNSSKQTCAMRSEYLRCAGCAVALSAAVAPVVTPSDVGVGAEIASDFVF
mmetsp:Transcript_5912/g.16058  ORF Transcript_5912/g.16058 Transcript_5912/m.16058 type:complete len:116 (-) Transcript_5912:2311-2658(-)